MLDWSVGLACWIGVCVCVGVRGSIPECRIGFSVSIQRSSAVFCFGLYLSLYLVRVQFEAQFVEKYCLNELPILVVILIALAGAFTTLVSWEPPKGNRDQLYQNDHELQFCGK